MRKFLVKTLESFKTQTELSYQYRRHGGHDGGGAEAVADHGEVGEVSLDAGVHQRLGPCVAEGRPVLVQEVNQLLADEPVFGSLVLKYFQLERYLVATRRSFHL